MGNQNNKQQKKNQPQLKVMKCPKCQMIFQHSNIHEVSPLLTQFANHIRNCFQGHNNPPNHNNLP